MGQIRIHRFPLTELGILVAFLYGLYFFGRYLERYLEERRQLKVFSEQMRQAEALADYAKLVVKEHRNDGRYIRALKLLKEHHDSGNDDAWETAVLYLTQVEGVRADLAELNLEILNDYFLQRSKQLRAAKRAGLPRNASE